MKTGQETARNIARFIADKLRSERKYQKDLAVAIGVPTSTVNTWITKGRDIPAQHILPIANFLGVSVYKLLCPTLDQDQYAAPATKPAAMQAAAPVLRDTSTVTIRLDDETTVQVSREGFKEQLQQAIFGDIFKPGT